MLRRQFPPSPVRSIFIARNFNRLTIVHNQSLLVSSSSSFFSVNKQQQEQQQQQNQTAKSPPSSHPQKLQAKPKQHQRRKPAVATFVEEEAEILEASSSLPSSTIQNTEEEHVPDNSPKQEENVDEINNNKNQNGAPDAKADPFSKPKSWSSSSSKLKNKQADKQQQLQKSKSNKNLGGKKDIQTISKVRKSLLDQFPDIYQPLEGEDQQEPSSSSSSVLQFLSPERQQELRKQDPQYEITLKERVDDYFDENSTSTGAPGSGSHDEEQQQNSSYQNLGIKDITATEKSDDDKELSSSSSSLLAHPDELNLTEYQRKLLQEKRSEEYGVLRRNFLKVFEGHHNLANKCHLLSALHEKVVERRMRLSTDVYEDFFLTFVRHGDSIMNTHKEGQVLPHFATSGSSSSSSSIKNRATASSLSSVSQLRKIERQLHLLNERRSNHQQDKTNASSSSSSSFSSSSSSLLKARTSSLHVSDFGFAEVVWSAYNYMLASGTKSSHRILQHVMRCLQFGGVQGGRAELERRAHQVLMDNCDPRAIAARQQTARVSPIVPTTYTLISYIEICAQVGSMHVALAMYIHALKEFRLTPDAVVTTVLLNGFLKNHFEWVRKQQQQHEQEQSSSSSSPHLDSAIRFMRHIHSVPMDVVLLNTMLNVLRHSKEPVSCFSAMRVVTGEESVLSEQREQVAFPIQAHTITTLLEAWNSCLSSWFPATTSSSVLSPPRPSDKQNDDGNDEDQDETSTSSFNNNNNIENKNTTTKVPQYLRHHLTADDSLSAGSITSSDTRVATMSLTSSSSSSSSLLSFHEKQEELDQRQFNQNWNRAQILARELRFILTLSVKNQIKMSASTSAKLHFSASQLVVLAQELKRSLSFQKEKLLAQQQEREELFVSQQQSSISSEDEEVEQSNNNNNSKSLTNNKNNKNNNNNHITSNNSLKLVKNKIKRNQGQTDVLDKIERHFSGVKMSLSEQMMKRGLSTYLEEK